jgi:hypothetical protein
LLVCFACIALPAQAEGAGEERPFTVALEYTAPAHCPSDGDFRSIVARRLGYEPFREDASERVLVIVVPTASGVEGRFQWLGSTGHAAGEQSFPAGQRDCGELVRTMGLALAVQIHLLATANEPSAGVPPATGDAASSTAAKAPPSRASSSLSPTPVEVAVRPPNSLKLLPFLGAGVGAGFGVAPAVVPLVRVFGGVAWSHATLELGGELSARSLGERDDDAGFAQELVLGSLAACGTYARASACAIAKVGAVRVSGRRIDEPRSPDGVAVELGLRLDYRQPLGAWAFVAPRASVLGNLNRWTITLDDLSVWRAPAIGADAGIDLGVVFQ